MKSRLFTYGTFLLCLLGMLSAFGPFVTDMYLPALPLSPPVCPNTTP
ncbi:MAG: hypothetical protein KIG47_06430 [Prevotellamassilia sp.]|nr:hypothetical protein [Prevotellamassilia sp.]